MRSGYRTRGAESARPPSPPALPAGAPDGAKEWPSSSLHGSLLEQRVVWAPESINYGQKKITVPGDWGSGTPARTVLPPRAAGQAGGVSHEAQKKGRAGADGGGRLGTREKIRKQSLTVTRAGPEGLCPQEDEGGSPQDCGGEEEPDRCTV